MSLSLSLSLPGWDIPSWTSFVQDHPRPQQHLLHPPLCPSSWRGHSWRCHPLLVPAVPFRTVPKGVQQDPALSPG